MGKTKEKVLERKKKKHKKHSSDSDSSIDEEFERRVKKELKRLKKKEKKKRKEKRALKKLAKDQSKKVVVKPEVTELPEKSYDINISLMTNSQGYAPMTKEQWEKQKSILRKVYDEDTGRTRLVRGDGEIVEECVSRDRHLAINKQATKGDGEHFQRAVTSQLRK